jgi:hypothetical protein
LLPAQQASGNWVKVVQRVPVRIAIEPDDLKSYPLRVGLSMRVRVDVSRKDGLRLTHVSTETAKAQESIANPAKPAKQPSQQSAIAAEDPAIHAKIRSIIEQHAQP